jgi:hypothetical protein
MSPPVDHYREVAQLLLEGRLIVFMGAGASLTTILRGSSEVVEAGNGSAPPFRIGEALPGGAELAHHLKSELQALGITCPDETGDDLAKVAQFAVLAKDEQWLYDRLHRVLNHDFPPTEVHEVIASIPARQKSNGYPLHPPLVLTSNYDHLMETAFDAADPGMHYDVLSYVVDGEHAGSFRHKAPGAEKLITIKEPATYEGIKVKGDLCSYLEVRPTILKIHGTVCRADPALNSFVITEDHYIEYLAKMDVAKFLPATIAGILSQHRFLFLGYSLTHWNLRALLRSYWEKQPRSMASWSIQRNPTALDTHFWASRMVHLFDCELVPYAQRLKQELNVLAPL